MKDKQITTTVAELAEALRPIIRQEVEAAIPDRVITQMEGARILGVSINTIKSYIREGYLRNVGTGKQRPKLSWHEVAALKTSGHDIKPARQNKQKQTA